MILLREENESIEILKEEDKKTGQKDYFIRGPFMQSEVKNRNGRIYPRQVMEKEVNRYVKENVEKNRALGELGHPESATVNLDRVSHMIKELKMDGNNVIGKAKIIDTPMGKISKNLIDEGVKLGVSSRAMGSVETKNGVQYIKPDFKLASVDIVADPSGPDCFVEGIMEGYQWIYEAMNYNEERLEKMKKKIRSTVKSELEETKLKLFSDFLKSI